MARNTLRIRTTPAAWTSAAILATRLLAAWVQSNRNRHHARVTARLSPRLQRDAGHLDCGSPEGNGAEARARALSQALLRLP